MLHRSLHLPLAAVGLALFLGACATVPADRGLSDVSSLMVARGAPALMPPDQAQAQAKAAIGRLLGQQLSVEDALSIALVNNARIRAEYSRLGIAGSDVLEAGRLSNPRLSVSVLDSNAAGQADQVGFGLAQSFTDLLLLRARSRIASSAFERTKAQAGAAVMELTRDVEAAWFRLVGAQQVAEMRASVAQAAGASAELAQRFFNAGNLNDLELSLEKVAAAQAEQDLLSAQAEIAAAQYALGMLMGLPASETRWSVGSRLSLPVEQEDELRALEDLAFRNRLDLDAARREVALLRDALDVTKTYRLLGNFEVGVETERETDGSRITGPTYSLELPIFNQNQGGVLRAQSLLELAQAGLKAMEVEISNQVALAHADVLTARRSVNLFRQRLVPLRERVVQRMQEQVNYMLLGVFDLIRAKRDQYDAYQDYLQAVRDYWLARTDLARAVGAPLPSSAKASEEAVAPERPVPVPEAGGAMHHGHGATKGMPAMPEMKEMEHSGHGQGTREGASEEREPAAVDDGGTRHDEPDPPAGTPPGGEPSSSGDHHNS